MNTVSVAKSAFINMFEGLALVAICQAFPIMANTMMMLKLARSHQIVEDPSRFAMLFVPMCSLFFALLIAYFGPKFPRFFKTSYEPAFFNQILSFADKIATWRERPTTSAQLLASTILLSLLAVAVVSMG